MSGSAQRNIRSIISSACVAFALLSLGACNLFGTGSPSSTPTPAPSSQPTPNPKIDATATWNGNGQAVTLFLWSVNWNQLQLLPGFTPPTPAGQVTGFETNASGYTCLNTLDFNVYSDPPLLKGYYIVTAFCLPGAQTGSQSTYSTWAFKQPGGSPPPPTQYHITWHNRLYSMSPVNDSKKPLPIENPQSYRLVGIASAISVQTPDLRMQCLNSVVPGVWVADKNSAAFPWPNTSVGGKEQATYIVEARCGDGTRGAWTFTSDAPPTVVLVYIGQWSGHHVNMALTQSLPPGTATKLIPDKVALIYTDDINYACFNPDQLLNTFQLLDTTTGQPTGQYFAEGNCLLPSTTYGSWIFPVPAVTAP